MYKNQIQKLNESRVAYKRLFREAVGDPCSQNNNIGAQHGQNHVDCGGNGQTCNGMDECELMSPGLIAQLGDEMEYGTNTKGEADIIDCSDRAVSKQFLDILGNKKNYQPRTTEEVVKAYENFHPRIPPQVTKELRSVEEVIDYSGIGGGGGTPGPQAIVLWIIGGITVGLCGWMGYEWSQLPRGGTSGGGGDGGGGNGGGGNGGGTSGGYDLVRPKSGDFDVAADDFTI